MYLCNVAKALTQTAARCCDMLGVVGSDLTILNMSQQCHCVACRNRVAKRPQHFAPNNDAICCIEMLRSFGRGFKLENTSFQKGNLKGK